VHERVLALQFGQRVAGVGPEYESVDVP